MKENAILIRQLDVLKVYVDFDDPNGIEKAVNARRVSTIHTAKTQEISNKLGIHLVGYVDREGNDINNELACRLSGYDYLGSFMLLCKTDDKFNNYGFSKEELECVYTYITTGKVISATKANDATSFFDKYGIELALPNLYVEPKIYIREDVPYVMLLRYNLNDVPSNKLNDLGISLFGFSSFLIEKCQSDDDHVELSNDGKFYLKCLMENETGFYNILIQAREENDENLLKNAEAVIQKGFLNPEKPKSSYNEDDVDTSLEEAID